MPLQAYKKYLAYSSFGHKSKARQSKTLYFHLARLATRKTCANQLALKRKSQKKACETARLPRLRQINEKATSVVFKIRDKGNLSLAIAQYKGKRRGRAVAEDTDTLENVSGRYI